MKRILSDANKLGLRLAPTRAQQLQHLEQLLLDRAVPMGLIASSDRGRIYERHLLDSLRSAALFRKDDRLAYDLGSGAGLPGVVLAIALPECRFVLAEVRSRRAAFLEFALERLGLSNAEVHAGPADGLNAGADVITARAFTSLEPTWLVAAPLLRPGGRLIYFAGESLEEPERTARAAPGPPRRVRVDPVLETSSPLVIMTLE